MARSGLVSRDSGTWLRLMLVAFLANGIGPFGLKVLSEQGLAGTYQAQYLAVPGTSVRSCSPSPRSRAAGFAPTAASSGWAP